MRGLVPDLQLGDAAHKGADLQFVRLDVAAHKLFFTGRFLCVGGLPW